MILIRKLALCYEIYKKHFLESTEKKQGFGNKRELNWNLKAKKVLGKQSNPLASYIYKLKDHAFKIKPLETVCTRSFLAKRKKISLSRLHFLLVSIVTDAQRQYKSALLYFRCFYSLLESFCWENLALLRRILDLPTSQLMYTSDSGENLLFDCSL